MLLGSSFGSSLWLVRSLLLVQCVLVFARLLLTLEWPRLVLRSPFGLAIGGGGAPLGGSWLASASTSTSSSTSNATTSANSANNAPWDAARFEEHAVDLKSRFCCVALVAFQALVDAERGRVFQAFGAQRSRLIRILMTTYAYTDMSIRTRQYEEYDMSIAPLLFLNWLVTETFAAGVATRPRAPRPAPALHPLSTPLVLLLFLPDTLYIPELLTSHGSLTYDITCFISL